MQAEEQKNEDVKPEEPPKPKEPERSRKDELLAKKAFKQRKGGGLTKAEQKELDAILEEERLEHERGALIHRLTEEALKYERREDGKIRREVTDRVKLFSQQESNELKVVRDSIKKERKEAKKVTEEAVASLQKDLKDALAALDAKESRETKAVQDKYREQYNEASEQIEHDVRNVGATVRYFKDEIQNLTLEQLQTLQKDGVVQIGEVQGNPDYLVAPGSDKS